MILVTGATGTAGSQVVRALAEQGHGVRVFARDEERAFSLFGDAVEVAHGDFGDSTSVKDALGGVTKLFLSCADDPRRVEWETGTIDAAARAGVQRIVKLSSVIATPGLPVAFWDWHGQVEEHLRRSGVPAVLLHSSYYMSNVLGWAELVAREGRIYAPAGDARFAMIDPRDVGAAAAAALTSDGHEGQTYALSGPEALTYADVARELSAVTGREVEYVDVPKEGAWRGMVEAGLPEFVAEQLVEMYAMAREGVAQEVTSTVQTLTGRPPRRFADFAHEHAGLFGSPELETVR